MELGPGILSNIFDGIQVSRMPRSSSCNAVYLLPVLSFSFSGSIITAFTDSLAIQRLLEQLLDRVQAKVPYAHGQERGRSREP